MVWEYEKFRGDMAIYAFFPKCNFHHNPSELTIDADGKREMEIKYQYNFCPICGEYLYDEKAATEGIDIVWNERDIEDLYSTEI